MRHLSRLLLAISIILGPALGTAAAADIRDLLLLKSAGLSDDLLIDLIQTDGSVFHLKAQDILALRDKGISERVIRAMLGTAKVPQAQPVQQVPDAPAEDRVSVSVNPADPQSDLVTPPEIEMPAAPPTPAQTDTAAPHVGVPPAASPQVIYVPVAVPVVVEHHGAPAPAPQPVYWGYGGQRRPDAWQDANSPAAPAPTKPKDTKPGPGRGGD